MAVPKPKSFWPLQVTSGVNDKIDFSRAGTPFTASLGTALYLSPKYILGEAIPSLHTAVESAMRAACGVNDIVVTLDGTTGRFAIRCTGAALALRFGTGANVATSAHGLLGYFGGDVGVGANVDAVANYQHQNGWYAPDPVQDDTGDLGEFTRVQAVALNGAVKSLDFGARDLRTILLAHVPAAKAYIADEGATTNEALERLIRSGWTRFRWWPDASVEGVWADYVLDLETAKQIPRRRLSPAAAYYDFTLRMRPYL